MKKLCSHLHRKHSQDPTADDYDTDPDTDNAENSENEFCMEVHGREEWVWDYSEENNIQIVDGTRHRTNR